jgi:uncharacterized protein (TIGR03663 family)
METEDIRGAERNTGDARGATPIVHRWQFSAIDLAILVLAAVLRLLWLDMKPAHFDEGVNGLFVDDMTKRGFYHYDPTNFHGPLHFYVIFVAQTLFGRDVWVLRLPLALASLACVAVALFGFRRFLSARASRIGALAMAVSPGFVFYGRYAIHETWLVLFLMVFTIGLLGWLRDRAKRDLWIAGAGLTGMMLTKETWIIHLAALDLAVLALLLLECLSPSANDRPRPLPGDVFDELCLIAAASLGVLLFFYTGGLIDQSGIGGFFLAFDQWSKTGTGGESGHGKEWWYWLDLLGKYEWPTLLGAVAALFVVLPRVSRELRWLAISAVGTGVAYSIIHYKTPWCLIAFAWPFCLTFGVAVDWVMKRVDEWTVGAVAGLVCMFSFAKSHDLNFHRFTDENEPYVYVQTTLDIEKLLRPLRWQVEGDPTTRYLAGHVMQPEHHPLLWLLGDRPNVTFGAYDDAPVPLDAEWLLVDSIARDRIEEGLTEPYFRDSVQVRGMAPDRSMLYLRASSFADYFPGREPEFVPKPKEEQQ